MVNEEIISQRISKIRKYLKYLVKAKNTSYSDFEDNEEFQIVLERSVQIIGQAIIDIGNHVISQNNWGKPQSYREIIIILKRNNVINEKYYDELAGLTSLRNILVHDYLNIDVELIYKDVKNGIEAIQWFIAEIEKKFVNNRI